MSLLYDLIFEMKTDLSNDKQLNVELPDGLGSIIRTEDKIACYDGILIIRRGEYECLIPLEKVLRVRSEPR